MTSRSRLKLMVVHSPSYPVLNVLRSCTIGLKRNYPNI